MNQLPVFDESGKDLRDELNHLMENLEKLATGARWFRGSWEITDHSDPARRGR